MYSEVPPPCYEVEPPLCINLYKGGVLSSIKLSALIGYRQGKRLCEGDIEGASHKAYRLIKGRLAKSAGCLLYGIEMLLREL